MMSEGRRGYGRGPLGSGTPAAPTLSSVSAGAKSAVASLRLAYEADSRRLAAILLIEVLTAAAELTQLLAADRAVDSVLAGDLRRAQLRRLLVVGAAGFVHAGGQSIAMSVQLPLGRAVASRAEDRVIDVALAVELAQLEDPEFQDRLQNALQAAHAHTTVLRNAIALPSALVSIASSLALMGSSDRALIPLALIGAIPQWFVARWVEDPMSGPGPRWWARDRMTLRQQMTGPLTGHELRAFNSAPFLRGIYDEISQATLSAEAAHVRKGTLKSVGRSVGGRLVAAPVAGRLITQATRRATSAGDAVAGGFAAQRVNGGIRRAVQMISTLRRASSQVDAYTEFVRDAPTPTAGQAVTLDFSQITLDGIAFTYPGSTSAVLNGVTLQINRGEVVALVGENGSGKTTLAKVLCALYQPTGGTIMWDDVDVGQLDPAAVRSNIAVVFQNFVQYPTLTAAQNIAVGRPELANDEAAITTAATRAGAHDFIVALPAGYATVLSRSFGGQDLSTGQWQRVALARAFLRDAPLVVLDEPTSALDPRAERDLFATVASLYRNRSALLISHRLSSVRFADRVCVLANGKIEETGTHDELLAAGGTYAELFELQAQSYR